MSMSTGTDHGHDDDGKTVTLYLHGNSANRADPHRVGLSLCKGRPNRLMYFTLTLKIIFFIVQHFTSVYLLTVVFRGKIFWPNIVIRVISWCWSRFKIQAMTLVPVWSHFTFITNINLVKMCSHCFKVREGKVPEWESIMCHKCPLLSFYLFSMTSSK